MSSRTTALIISIGSTLALVAGLALASEVRAGAHGLDPDDIPVEGMVDGGSIEAAQAFAGDWVYIGGQKQRDGIEAAIAASMDAVSPMLRKLGTKRLRESNPVPGTISVGVEGTQVKILFDGQGHEAALDGAPIKANNDGEKVKISHRLRGASLYQFIDGGGGDRHNTFKLSEDGQRMTLKVKITSGHLPVPCEYRLSFKRKG